MKNMILALITFLIATTSFAAEYKRVYEDDNGEYYIIEGNVKKIDNTYTITTHKELLAKYDELITTYDGTYIINCTNNTYEVDAIKNTNGYLIDHITSDGKAINIVDGNLLILVEMFCEGKVITEYNGGNLNQQQNYSIDKTVNSSGLINYYSG